MCYGYIYLIEDITNGMKYVGQHKYKNFMLDDTYHGSGRIIKYIRKKRPETLKIDIVCGVDSIDEANFFEEYWIEKLNTVYQNGYNLTTGGDVNIPSEELRKRMIEHNPMKNPEVVKKMINTKKRKYCREKHPMFGRKLPDVSKLMKEHNPMKNPEVVKKMINTRRKKHPERFVNIDFDFLYKKYVIEKVSPAQIAKECGISRGYIYEILNNTNFPRMRKKKTINNDKRRSN